MNILLVDPGSSRSEINEPIGIGMIASAVQIRLSGRVSVMQYFAPINGLPDIDAVCRADILGISTPLGSMNQLRSLITMWSSIEMHRRPVLVLGGVIATFAPNELLAEFPDAILVIGEGEDAFSSLASILVNTGEIGWLETAIEMEVPNLAFQMSGRTVFTKRRNTDFAALSSPQRPFLKQLKSVGGIVRTESSRGCSYGKCTFCAIQHKYNNEINWRTTSIPRIISDLVKLSECGVQHPYFTDEDFIGNNPARAMAIALEIKKQKALGQIADDFTLYVDMRVTSILARATSDHPSGLSVIKSLYDAGLREVFVGIESGTGEQVQRYRKPATATRNLRALHLLRRVGLSIDVGFIFFDPEMTLNEAEENLQFLRTADLWYHDSRLTKEIRLEGGTPLVGIYKQKNLISGPIDVNALTYPYRWRNSHMQAVHEVFKDWEAIELDAIYALQAATRGEVPTEYHRKARRNLLGKIRATELDALQCLVTGARHGKDPNRLDLSNFSQKREQLINQSRSVFKCLVS